MTEDELARFNFVANAIYEIASEIKRPDDSEIENLIQKLADTADALSFVTSEWLEEGALGQSDKSGVTIGSWWGIEAPRYGLAVVSAGETAYGSISLMIGSDFFNTVAVVDHAPAGWLEARDS